MKTLTQKFGIGLGVAALAAMGAINAQAQDGGTWTMSQTRLPTPTKLASVSTSTGGQIVVIGGRNGGNSLGIVTALQVTGGRVTAAQARPVLQGELRDAGNAATCPSGLVVQLGGSENSGRTRQANEALGIQLMGRQMNFLVTPQMSTFGLTAAVGNMIFVISGDVGAAGVSRRVQAFNCNSVNLNAEGGNRGNLAGDPFVARSPIPTGVARAASTVAGGKIFVTGGRAMTDTGPALNLNQRFDPASNSWMMLKPMTATRFGHVLVTLNDNEIMAVGGTDGQQVLTSAEIYNVQMDQWTPAASLPMGLVDADGVSVGNNQAVIVGGSRSADANGASLNQILEFSRSGGDAAVVAPTAPAAPSSDPLPTPLP